MTSAELATKIDTIQAKIHKLEAEQKTVGIRKARKLAKEIETLRTELTVANANYRHAKKGGKTRRRRASSTRRNPRK